MRRVLYVLTVLCLATPALAQGVMPTPVQTFWDNQGNPCAACRLYAFAAGTTTPQATFTESTLTTAQSHPIVLDASGRATVYLSAVSYQFRLDQAVESITIWTQDNISAGAQVTATESITGQWNFSTGPTMSETAPAEPDLSKLYNESLVKAWAVVTFSAGVPSLANFYNVSSITDIAPGRTTVTFATDLGINTYACVANPDLNEDLHALCRDKQTGSVEVLVETSAGANTDENFSVIVIGQ